MDIMKYYKDIFKPLFDFFISIFGLIILSPVFIIVSVLLSIANKGNPFFSQLRPGKNEKPFNILKFKTMNDKKDIHGKLLPDKDRLTPIGRIIRKTSLDEIPQLLNVITGDMSLIGPRPLLFKYLPLYTPEQYRRMEVRPGITGWAQVNGRNAISWEKKFEYDVWYIDNLTFILDLKILILTIKKVLSGAGISSATSATIEPFRGTTGK